MYRLLTLLALFAQAPRLLAEEQPPIRILKGELIEWAIRGLAGELAMRAEDYKVTRCRVLPTSHLMRANIRIHPHGIRIGDAVEIVADFREGENRCAVQTLYVRPAEPRRPPPAPSAGIRLPLYARSYLDTLWIRGSLTFAGVVCRVEPKVLVVRMRDHHEQTFTIRDETMFSDSGRLVESVQLEVYTRVFIRASRAYDGSLEALQVAWGGILRPNH